VEEPLDSDESEVWAALNEAHKAGLVGGSGGNDVGGWYSGCRGSLMFQYLSWKMLFGWIARLALVCRTCLIG
jgi:hypothetical protein